MINISSKSSLSIGLQRQKRMHYALCNMHTPRWLLLTLCLVAIATGHARVKEAEPLTASQVFAEIPLEVLDMIRPSMRLDMIDYYNQADSLLAVTNALGGESRLMEAAPDHMKVSVTPISTLEIKILPLGKRQMVMTLYTVASDQGEGSEEPQLADTEVRFFDENLKPLDTDKYLKAPTLKDFFNLKGSDLTEEDLRDKIPFAAIAYTAGPGEAPLTATLTSLSSLSKEERELLRPLLIPSLSAGWRGKFQFK